MPAGPAALGLGALALFILYGSSGPWAGEVSRAAELPGISLPDIAQNLLLYVPFGLLGVWALRGVRLRPRALFLSLTALGLAYSAVMELLQMLLADRIASPLDVVANVAGTIIGALLAAPVEQAGVMATGQIRRTGLFSTPASYVLVVLLATIVMAAWYPFDITLDISTLSERTLALRRDPWLRPVASELWMQGGQYCLLAAITVFCLPKLAKWAAPLAIVFAGVVAVVVDLGQLGMGSQPIGLAAFAAQAVGAFAGAAAALLVTLVRGREYASA